MLTLRRAAGQYQPPCRQRTLQVYRPRGTPADRYPLLLNVGNDAIATSHIWAHAGKLYVRTENTATPYIYHRRTAAPTAHSRGRKTIINLPQGVYIIEMSSKRWKVTAPLGCDNDEGHLHYGHAPFIFN
jgi:hypothetical protein